MTISEEKRQALAEYLRELADVVRLGDDREV